MNYHNKGLEVEDRVRKLLRGTPSSYDKIDFFTKKNAYECKSCQLFAINAANGNQKRPFKKKPHKPCSSIRFGRFSINRENHVMMKVLADDLKKKPYYIFALSLGRQLITKRMTWQQVNMLVNPDKESSTITIRQVWQGDIR